MNRRLLAAIGLIALGILVFWAGTLYGQSRWLAVGGQTGWMMGNGMMNNRYSPNAGPGMMAGSMGMMGNSGLLDANPLSIEDAETAVTSYLNALNNDSLTLGEIMIFDNHAYAQIIDESTGQGAFEVLVDPVTRNVFPEPGPNMMWNTEYGMMSDTGNFGMMGMMGGGMMNGRYGSGMMGNFGYAPDAEINITTGEAVDIAQEYLDTYLPGKTAGDIANSETVAFPGYYTLHVREDGEVVGMLSVNAYTGQVFLHQWHGDFIKMTGEARGS